MLHPAATSSPLPLLGVLRSPVPVFPNEVTVSRDSVNRGVE